MRAKCIILILLLSISMYDVQCRSIDSLGDKIDSIEDYNDRCNMLMDYAENYRDINTEFALDCAYKAHEYAINIDDKRLLAESSVLMGDIFCQTHSYPTAIEYYEEAIMNYESLNEYDRVVRLYIMIANLYQDSNFDPQWSFNAMKKAEKYAGVENDKHLYIDTYLAFADLYLKQDNDSLAHIYYEKVLAYPIENKTIRSIAKALTGEANIKLRNKDYDDAISLIDTSTYICIRDFYDELLVDNYGYKAVIFDSIGKHDKAVKYYLQAIKLAYSINDFNNCGEYMLSLGLLNKRLNNYDAAIEILEMLRDSTESFRMYELCYKSYYHLSRCYASMGRYEDAYNTLNHYDAYYDSANIERQEKKINELKTSYILSMNIKELNEKEMELNEIKLKRYNLTFIIIATISISLLLISFTILYSRNKILKKRNKYNEYKQQLELNEMSNKMMEMQLRNNKESLINLALHLKSFIEYITPLKNELRDLTELPYEEQKSKIKNIYQNMQNNFTMYNNMEILHGQIDEIYKDFLNRLEQKYPAMTKSEKRLCSMLYINMSSKEIAVITNTSLRSVETSRYRLRKKFNLNRDEDIIKFLKSI